MSQTDTQIVDELARLLNTLALFHRRTYNAIVRDGGVVWEALETSLLTRAVDKVYEHHRQVAAEAAADRLAKILFPAVTIPVLHVPFHRGLRNGDRFGELRVLRYLSLSADKQRRRYECLCDCGRTRMVTEQALTSGKVTTCSFTHESGAAKSARRKAAKILRTPPWASRDAIAAFYAGCPRGFHVDHIVPLQGELVSGLHVEHNLQYLAAGENIRKGNKFTPYVYNRTEIRYEKQIN